MQDVNRAKCFSSGYFVPTVDLSAATKTAVAAAAAAGPPEQQLSRQRRLVPLRTLVQSAAPAAGRVAGGTLIERSLFTGRNGPFLVTVIYMQVITAGHDGWRCPIYLDYPEIKHVSEISKCQKPLRGGWRSRFGPALTFLRL